MVIHSRVESPKWKDVVSGEEARCRKFPLPSREKGITDDPFFKQAADALPICNGFEDDGSDVCPLRDQCLLWSLVNNDAFGVWGGMTVPQRKWIRRYIPRAKWYDVEYLRAETPGPDYFKDYGDDEDDDEAEG